MNINAIFSTDKWDFKTQSILANLPAEEFAALTAHQSEQKYAKGELIFREGAYASGIFYLQTGKVKKYKVVGGDGEQIIYIANAGELIGYHAVLLEGRFSDSAATLEECQIAFIPKEDFLAVLYRSPMLMGRFLKVLSHEFTVLTNGMALLSQRTVRERFALQLILLQEKYKAGLRPGVRVEINLSREDLAKIVGTGRENIVRILSEFKDLGVLETRGRKIVVRDVEALIKMANYR